MKSYKYLAALLLPALMSCGSDDVQYHIETPEDQMLISASAEDLVLDAADADKEVLTFSWNAPADRGEGTSIKSYFRMDIADNNFATASDLIEIEPGQTSISFTADDLNDYLLGWGVSPETKVRIEAEIVASVEGSEIYMKPELSTTTMLLTGYRAVSRPLWIVNAGMDAFADDQMNEIVLSKQYSWSGKFEEGKGVKFVYDKTTQLPSLNKGDDNNSIVKRTEDGDPDDLFEVSSTGYYNVTVSTKTMSVTWEKLESSYEDADLWMVGNAAPCGWDIGNPTPMEHDAVMPGVFVWEGYLNTGEIKMPLATGSWGVDYLMPVVNQSDQDSDDNVQFIAGGNPDNKWNITKAGNYRVVVNTYMMKIKFIPLD